MNWTVLCNADESVSSNVAFLLYFLFVLLSTLLLPSVFRLDRPSVLDVLTQIPQNILFVRVHFHPLRVTLGVGGIIHPQRQFDFFLLFASHFPEYSPFSAYFPSPSSHAHLNFLIFKFSGPVFFVLWRCSYFPIFYFHGSR